MFIDYHTHINFSAFKNDADAVIKRALDSGVFMILVGTQINTSRRAVEIASHYKNGVYAAIGLHPIHLEETEIDEEEINFKTRAEIFDPDKYRVLARNEKVVAIGECGLDYFHSGLFEKQQEVFRQHLDLSDELGLPIILHCRGSKDDPEDAYNDLLKILKERKLKNGGVIHCFMSTLDIAQKFIALDFYIGFTGVITFPKTEKYAEVIRSLPADKILAETDCPYLTPVPFRGKRNEPMYVKYVVKKISEIKNIEMEDQLYNNTRRLFPKMII